MRPPFDIRYVDRATGAIRRETVFAAPFLYWSYNTAPGRFLTRFVLSRRAMSAPFGWICRRRLSRHLIAPFVRRSGMDPSKLPRPIGSYGSFHDFFTRENGSDVSHDAAGDAVCRSPVDGKALVIEGLRPQEILRIKRCTFNLRRLVGSEELVEVFSGGSMAIFRLCLTDYHRFHFPVAGVAQEAVQVGGRCYAGGPYDLSGHVPFYVENTRMITRIDSPRFGPVAMVEIGAFTVGSIVQSFRPGAAIAAGDQKGWFEPGGSTVVLLFRRRAIAFDSDLVRNSGRDLETRVRCGQRIGCAALCERRAAS